MPRFAHPIFPRFTLRKNCRDLVVDIVLVFEIIFSFWISLTEILKSAFEHRCSSKSPNLYRIAATIKAASKVFLQTRKYKFADNIVELWVDSFLVPNSSPWTRMTSKQTPFPLWQSAQNNKPNIIIPIFLFSLWEPLFNKKYKKMLNARSLGLEIVGGVNLLPFRPTNQGNATHCLTYIIRDAAGNQSAKDTASVRMKNKIK